MSFLKSLLIDLLFITVYYILYKFLGFELMVIFALSQIVSHLIKKEYPKKPKNIKQVYVQPKTRMKF